MLSIVSSRYPLHGAAYSNIGGRPENQDSLCVCETQLGLLVVVSDGMGGGPEGKTASTIAVEVIAKTVAGYAVGASREEALKVAIGRANDAMAAKVREMPQLTGMGATVVIALINKESAVVANIGDSRCYRIGKGKTRFRTNDHSFVGELVRRKVLTEEQARTSPQSNVISKALGTTNDHVPDLYEVCYCKGDRLVLCTDGVWGAMTDKELIMRLAAPIEVCSLVDGMASEVDRIGHGKGGYHDNHTMAVIEMDNNSIKTDGMSKTMKVVLAILSVFFAVSVVFNIVCSLKLRNNNYVEELNLKNRMIERLEPYRERYEKLCNSQGDALRLTVKERDSLYNTVLELEHMIDSLLNENNIVQSAKINDVSRKTEEEVMITASACVDNLVRSLTKLRDVNAASQSETVRLKMKYRDEAVDWLQQYVKIKGRTLGTDNIAILLRWSKIFSVEHDDKNRRFVSTKIVVTKINVAIETSNKLK